MKQILENDLTMTGWREWISLPELGIRRIKAKIDTGAKTSTLHAFNLQRFKKNAQHWVKFSVHPMQENEDIVISTEAEIIDIRWVMDSGGRRERRFFINTQLVIGKQNWPIEISLTNRDMMRFRMLLGRTALKNHLIVNPALSYLISDKENL